MPIQILWVNLVTDGLPAMALGVDQADSDLMRLNRAAIGQWVDLPPEILEVMACGLEVGRRLAARGAKSSLRRLTCRPIAVSST